MDLLNKYYVYSYSDPFTKIPFYIGKGCGQRKFNHFKETKEKTDNILKYRKIHSIIKKGKFPIVKELFSNLNETTAYMLETKFIKLYGRISNKTGVLTNICVDARPPSKKGLKILNRKKPPTFSLEHKLNLSKSLMGKSKNKGVSKPPRTLEHRKNISKSHTKYFVDRHKIKLEYRKTKSLVQLAYKYNIPKYIVKNIVYKEDLFSKTKSA